MQREGKGLEVGCADACWLRGLLAAPRCYLGAQHRPVVAILLRTDGWNHMACKPSCCRSAHEVDAIWLPQTAALPTRPATQNTPAASPAVACLAHASRPVTALQATSEQQTRAAAASPAVARLAHAAAPRSVHAAPLRHRGHPSGQAPLVHVPLAAGAAAGGQQHAAVVAVCSAGMQQGGRVVVPSAGCSVEPSAASHLPRICQP